MSNVPEPGKKDEKPYRSFNLYIILVCSILIVLSGIYMLISSKVSASYDCLYCDVPDHTGFVNGPVLIIVGFGLSIFPVYHLVKSRLKK